MSQLYEMEEQNMAFVSNTSKAVIKRQHKLMEQLGEKCSSCELLKGKIPEMEYIYTFHDIGYNAQGECPMLAIAQYNSCNTYAVYSQGEMTKCQLYAYEIFLRNIKAYAETGEQIVVFSQESYEFVKNYVSDKPIGVILHI